jgi:type II restriction/modification system DNA methylase subunit YeeA
MILPDGGGCVQPTLSPQEFVAKWRNVTLKERSASQSHFNDLCALLGTPNPVQADPEGTWYTFEAGAAKRGGAEGFADVWKRGFFAWEYKGRHANLDKAYEQLLKYRSSLQNPPLLIVSDTDLIVIHTNFTNTVERTETIALEELLNPARLKLLWAAFEQPALLRPDRTPEQVTQQAAAHFAELASLLRKYGEEPRAIAHFLIRLLFCLFAEDTGLLPRGIFAELVRGTQRRPEVFAHDLAELFSAMATGGRFALRDIAHFDGKLFDEAQVLPLDSAGLDILAGVIDLDWSAIEPSILGTLFERSLDPSKRSQLGAHYTSREDILLIVEPVLMAPLRERWAKVKAQAEGIAHKREQAGPGRAWQKLNLKLQQLLQGFAREISTVRVLDPACGSGNFLYVALRQLLDLWNEISTLAFDLGLPGMQPLEGDAPFPSQLHGIEINEYAYELAQTTVWIGYLQWMHDNGWGAPSEPILKPMQTILQMDAILSHDPTGHPVEPEWPAAEVIISNPPFLGGKLLRTQLGNEYVDCLHTLYSGRVPREADLVCYWFEKARAILQQGKVKRVGLLATQGIRGGANRKVLQRIKDSGDIFLAWADREWILDGATVHISMVGFDDGSETGRLLNGVPVAYINPDLTATIDLTVARRLPENANLAFMGDTKVGPFELSPQQARSMLAAGGNPNGRPNSDVLRRWVNGLDLTRRDRGMWIIDFGTDMTEGQAAQYEVPFEHVQRHVKPQRDRAGKTWYHAQWWLHYAPRPAMRAAIQPLAHYVATPRVAKHRLFVWLGSTWLPDCQLIVFAREDNYFFGVLHSRPHELWARRTGTQLREAESGFRYTPTTTFETFPFPWPPGQEPQDDPRVLAIAAAARELVEKRDAWLNPAGASEAELKKRTLTNLYNRRPTWLELAHRKLDEAVFAAYGWPADLDDDEILRRLLQLNAQRASNANPRPRPTS